MGTTEQKNIRELNISDYNRIMENLFYENGFNKKGTIVYKQNVEGNVELTPLYHFSNRRPPYLSGQELTKDKRMQIYRMIKENIHDITIDHFTSRLKQEEIIEAHRNQFKDNQKIRYKEIPKVTTIINFEKDKKNIAHYFPKQFKEIEWSFFNEHSITILWDRYLWKGEPLFNILLEESLNLSKKLKNISEVSHWGLMSFTQRLMAGDPESIIKIH